MVRRIFMASSALALAAIAAAAPFWTPVLWALPVVLPLIAVGVHDMLQRKHTLLRIYPVVGHGRYLFEAIRPEIQQYFVESNIDGAPFNREQRSIVYARSKGELSTAPFGTQQDVYRAGHEWIAHSLAAAPALAEEPRVRVGGPDCALPYLASRYNISAMSFGSLGKNAVRALNLGARRGGFCHNTGEGGLSPYHLEHGGDLCWQIGTGYFGCRTAEGRFDPGAFAERAKQDAVRLVEIKLSQGAKPAHGGILPAAKVSEEIARIRLVPMGADVLSPPSHSAFSSPRELVEFVARLRELSGGKPVGMKLCVGRRSELLAIVKAMREAGTGPDFITVDGAEGGTGAAPLEFTNSVGAPLREGLLAVHNALVGAGLRDRVRIVASGKIITAFDLLAAVGLGADLANSARGMMFALGCIQARRCNSNECPVGIATTDPARDGALDVGVKAERVARFHKETVHAFLELVAAAGLADPEAIGPEHLIRRVDFATTRTFAELYEFLEPGALLGRTVPDGWRADWEAADPAAFAPRGALRRAA